eukprot:5330233-Prymnesium_polylepis.2
MDAISCIAGRRRTALHARCGRLRRAVRLRSNKNVPSASRAPASLNGRACWSHPACKVRRRHSCASSLLHAAPLLRRGMCSSQERRTARAAGTTIMCAAALRAYHGNLVPACMTPPQRPSPAIVPQAHCRRFLSTSQSLASGGQVLCERKGWRMYSRASRRNPRTRNPRTLSNLDHTLHAVLLR